MATVTNTSTNAVNKNIIVPEVYAGLVDQKIAGKVVIAQAADRIGTLMGQVGETINFPSWVYTGDEVIGVDLALTEGKCFDNHLTAFSYGQKPNPQAVNLNNLCNICRNSYRHKYNTSTVLLLWSLYDLPKENLSEELMMLLLSIDGTQDAYYLYQGNFRGTLRKWLVDVLDLPEFYDCFERHTHSDFTAIRKKYMFDPTNTGHGKIVMEHGILDTAIDIDGINDLLAWECDVQIGLTTEKFYKKAVFQDFAKDIRTQYPQSIKSITDGEVYSYALTKAGLVNYSVKIDN